jgi:hypothetical protein
MLGVEFSAVYDARLDQVDISARLGDEQLGYIWIDDVSRHPVVGYASTGPNVYRSIRDNRRRGVGVQLYVFASIWLLNNQHGSRLYASQTQTSDAKSFWLRLCDRGWAHDDGTGLHLDVDRIA